jgi:Lysyl-tRNA synthetase (class II)
MGEQQKNVQEQDVNQLRKVRREKLADLQSNGKNPFEITKYDVTCHAQDVKDNYEEMEGKHVKLAGRVMQKRVMGKASFCNILDQSGNIQSYVARDSIGEEEYKDFKNWISEILSVWKVKYLRQRPERFPSTHLL